jgi:NTP pyrophosphatase (non-canonical NTP hydrolase)
MNANDYQKQAKRTLIDKPDFQITDKQVMIVWTATGLAGEAGEVSELIKKGIFHQHGIDREKIKKELGDVLWYVAGLAGQFDLTLEEIMEHNIEKLKARFPDGWSSEDSKTRTGLAE